MNGVGWLLLLLVGNLLIFLVPLWVLMGIFMDIRDKKFAKIFKRIYTFTVTPIVILIVAACILFVAGAGPYRALKPLTIENDKITVLKEGGGNWDEACHYLMGPNGIIKESNHLLYRGFLGYKEGYAFEPVADGETYLVIFTIKSPGKILCTDVYKVTVENHEITNMEFVQHMAGYYSTTKTQLMNSYNISKEDLDGYDYYLPRYK